MYPLIINHFSYKSKKRGGIVKAFYSVDSGGLERSKGALKGVHRYYIHGMLVRTRRVM